MKIQYFRTWGTLWYGARFTSPNKISPKSIFIWKCNVKFLLGGILLGEVNRALILPYISIFSRFVLQEPEQSLKMKKTLHLLSYRHFREGNHSIAIPYFQILWRVFPCFSLCRLVLCQLAFSDACFHPQFGPISTQLMPILQGLIVNL